MHEGPRSGTEKVGRDTLVAVRGGDEQAGDAEGGWEGLRVEEEGCCGGGLEGD